MWKACFQNINIKSFFNSFFKQDEVDKEIWKSERKGMKIKNKNGNVLENLSRLID